MFLPIHCQPSTATLRRYQCGVAPSMDVSWGRAPSTTISTNNEESMNEDRGDPASQEIPADLQDNGVDPVLTRVAVLAHRVPVLTRVAASRPGF